MIARTVTTKAYRNEMLDCFGKGAEAGEFFLFYMEAGSAAERIFCVKLANVMKKAILSSNSVLRSSERLTCAVEKIVFGGVSEKIEKGILSFLDGRDEIYLDGYIYFALNEYSHRINTVLYQVVRNGLRFTKEDNYDQS